MGSTQGVRQDRLRKKAGRVQTVKSSSTAFDLTKYSTSLNILGVLAVHGYALQNIVSAAWLLIWRHLGVVKEAGTFFFLQLYSNADCYSKSKIFYDFCLLGVC